MTTMDRAPAATSETDGQIGTLDCKEEVSITIHGGPGSEFSFNDIGKSISAGETITQEADGYD
jgi:hypothetical protein